MPQVKDDTIKDGWYVNKATDRDGTPRALSLGAVITFAPGQERHVLASTILESRSTHRAFRVALQNGNLAAKDDAAAPAPEPVKVPEPEPEPVDQTLTRTDLQNMNKASLIDMAEGMGLDTEGTKADLVDRILVSQE